MSGHPLQRAGAWAVAVLAERASPVEATDTDLAAVAVRIAEDASRAAVADKGTAAYDWWKVLFALYPNSKATHSKRPKDRTALRDAIVELLAPEGTDTAKQLPCTFCGAQTRAVWSKSNLPLFDTNKMLNTLPPGVPGWPVCRGCRVAAWALPYGAWVTAGSATVFSCESEVAERRFAERNVLRARRVMQLGFERLGVDGRPELVALRALRHARVELSASTLWSFKNDNQEPWLRVTYTRRAAPRFLALVEGNTPLRRGWRLLEIALTRRDKKGAVVSGGAAEAARLVFEVEDGRGRSFLWELHRLLTGSEHRWTPQHATCLARLAMTYAKEVLGMDPDLKPVTQLLVDWIEHGGSGGPRGRWAEYQRVALNPYELGRVLHRAQSRLFLDGREITANGEHWKPLIQRHPRAWEQRLLLSVAVVQALQERNVRVNDKPADAEEAEQVAAIEKQIDEAAILADDSLGAM